MYYIPTPSDNNKATRLLIVLIILFSLICYFMAPAQKNVSRAFDSDHGERFVCKTPNHTLQFRLLNNYKDTLFLSAIADSIKHPVYSIVLCSYYTEGIPCPDKGLKIWYSDGSTDEFEVYFINKEKRFIKYEIVGHSLENLFNKEMLAIDFSTVLYCENIREKKYFMDFFKEYDK